MLEDEGKCDMKEIKDRKIQFMINDCFLTTTLQELMEKLELNSESVLTLWYSFALEKPKQKLSIP